LGNKFFQDKWTFPINLITKLDEYWNNQHLSFDYNDELSSNQMMMKQKQKQQQKQQQQKQQQQKQKQIQQQQMKCSCIKEWA